MNARLRAHTLRGLHAKATHRNTVKNAVQHVALCRAGGRLLTEIQSGEFSNAVSYAFIDDNLARYAAPIARDWARWPRTAPLPK
jgi:hypothetical protein